MALKKIIFSRLNAIKPSTGNRLNLMKTIVHEYLAGLQRLIQQHREILIYHTLSLESIKY